MALFISNSSVYQPSPENPAELPKLAYADPLFKRRLSQISRMTIEVVHNLIEKDSEARDCKLVFASFRGEIARQLKVNKNLAEDADVMPASFSISVFNTPPAVATIALNMKAGYTAVYPSENDFRNAFIAAAAPVLCGSEKKIVFVYADELVPAEYKDCGNYTDDHPLAFACVLSAAGGKEIDLNAACLNSPETFLEFIKP